MLYEDQENSPYSLNNEELLLNKCKFSNKKIVCEGKENSECSNYEKLVPFNKIHIQPPKTSYNQNNQAGILTERDPNAQSLNLEFIKRFDFQEKLDDLPLDSLEGLRNAHVVNHSLLSPKFYSSAQSDTNSCYDNDKNSRSSKLLKDLDQRVKKWKTTKSKSISNIYIVDHSSPNEFISLYSKKNSEQNKEASKSQNENLAPNQSSEPDKLQNQSYIQLLKEKLEIAEQKILELKKENQNLIHQERISYFKIQDLTQKLERYGLFSSRVNLHAINTKSLGHDKEKDIIIRELQEEIENLRNDNDHLRYIQEKILLNDQIDTCADNKKDTTNLLFRQNSSFECSTVNLYEMSTLKTYQDTTLPALKESDLAISQIPREESREIKELRKFIESLTTLVLELSPPASYQGKPNLKDIWKWLQNFLNQYMTLKKKSN